MLPSSVHLVNCSGKPDSNVEPSARATVLVSRLWAGWLFWSREGVWSPHWTWVLISAPAPARCGDWTSGLTSQLKAGAVIPGPRGMASQVCSGCVQVSASMIVPDGEEPSFPGEGPGHPALGPDSGN